jgi:hypothetical protein
MCLRLSRVFAHTNPLFKPDSPAMYLYKVQDDECFNDLRRVLRKRGWLPYDERYPQKYNLHWKTSRYSEAECSRSSAGLLIRVNHFQQSSAITKKDTMARHLRRMRAIHGTLLFVCCLLSFERRHTRRRWPQPAVAHRTLARPTL